MNDDEFERQLQRQELSPLPAHWRSQILWAAAETCAPGKTGFPVPGLVTWWQALLWPCPKVWAGLGLIWCVILALDFSASTAKPVLMQAAVKPGTVISFVENRQLLSDILVPRKSASSATPAPTRRPRAERPNEFGLV